MIPYADFERALARWKVRQAGGDATVIVDNPVREVVTEAVISEAYAEVVAEIPSGHVTIDDAPPAAPEPPAELTPPPPKKRKR